MTEHPLSEDIRQAFRHRRALWRTPCPDSADGDHIYGHCYVCGLPCTRYGVPYSWWTDLRIYTHMEPVTPGVPSCQALVKARTHQRPAAPRGRIRPYGHILADVLADYDAYPQPPTH